MGGGKTPSISSAAAPAAAEAPKPYQMEQDTTQATQNAREAQLRKARAALGQEGSILTSPFGSQQEAAEQKKTLLGG
jgi:hypothetical protein